MAESAAAAPDVAAVAAPSSENAAAPSSDIVKPAEPTWRRENRERLEAALAKEAEEKKISTKKKRAALKSGSKANGAAARGKSPSKKTGKTATHNGASGTTGKKVAGGKKTASQQHGPSSLEYEPDDQVHAGRPARRKGSRIGKALAALTMMVPPVCPRATHNTRRHARARLASSLHRSLPRVTSQLPVEAAVEAARRAYASSAAAAPDAQRNEKQAQAQASGHAPTAAKQPGLIRVGSLVKLASADKKFDGQVGRVVEMNVKFAHTSEGLVSVLLAPKGRAQGLWVAVPESALTLQQ
jgi:hypothetical protein